MPYVRIRSVAPELLRSHSRALVDRLADALGCDRSWFTLELAPAAFFADGEESSIPPYVEVLAFERPPEQKRRVAAIIADELRGGGGPVTVVFRDIARGDYFEDGEPV